MGLTSVSFWLQLICIATIISKNIAFLPPHPVLTDIQQYYKLIDPAGFHTSYPYEGGQIEIQCKTSSGNSTFLTRNNSLGTGTPQRVEENTFELNTELMASTFQCDGLPGTVLLIEFMHCNPFSLIPKAFNCSRGQRCIVDKSGTATYEDKSTENCYYSSNSIWPDLRYGCPPKPSPGLGLCHVQSKFGYITTLITDDDYNCMDHENYYKWFANNHLYNDVVLVSFATKKWEFKSKYSVPFDCHVIDQKGQKLYNYEIKSEGKTSLEPEFALASLPVKVQLRCLSVKDKDGIQISFSNFVIVYDEDDSKYSAAISKARKQESVILTCTCEVPEGFMCGTSWTNPEKTRDMWIQDSTRQRNDSWNLIFKESQHIKQFAALEHSSQFAVGEWDYPEPRNYSCYMQVFAFNYPNTFNLIRLKLTKEYIETTVTVTPEDFVKDAGASKAQAKSTSEAANTINSKSSVLIALLVICLFIAVVLLALCILLYVKSMAAAKKLEAAEDKLNSVHSMLSAKSKQSAAGSRVGSLAGGQRQNSKVGSSVGKSIPAASSQARPKSSVG